MSKEECLDECYSICTQNYLFLKKFMEALEGGRFSMEALKVRYLRERREKYTDFVFKRNRQEQDNFKGRSLFSKRVRKDSSYESVSNRDLPLQVSKEFTSLRQQPIAFHEIHSPSQHPSQQKPPEQKMQKLFVLCHGFQGNSRDLILLRNNIKLIYSEAYFLKAKSYQMDSGRSLLEMGKELALEIQDYMRSENLDTGTTVVNFVAFSLGGLVARASLRHLIHLHFGKYMSICTPHLGVLGSSKMIKLGLWILKTFTRSDCIK